MTLETVSLELTAEERAFLIRARDNLKGPEAKLCQKRLMDALERGDPQVVCWVTNALKELEQCAEIDRHGNLVYDIDKFIGRKPAGEVVEMKRKSD